MHRVPGPAVLASLLTLLLLCASPAQATKRTVVLVADLAASKVSPEDAATLSDLLRGELARERKFVLVQRGEMEAIAEELEFQMSGCTEQGCAVQMGQMLNAEKVIVGRVAKLFGRLTISAQVVDMTANDIEFAEKVDCEEDYAAVAAAIAILARKLSAHVPLLAEVKGVAGDVVVLDGGSREGLMSGQRLTVLRSVVVKDAQGRPLMEKRQTVGEVEITYAGARDSEARKVSGEIREGDYARVTAGGAPTVTGDETSETSETAAVPAGRPTTAVDRPAPATTPPAANASGPTAAVPPPDDPPRAGSTITDPITGMELVCVAGGTFQMGDLWGDGHGDEKRVHQVTVSDFCIGKTEVTQAQWQTVMGSNPSDFKGSDRPVERVSWEDVQQFIAKLNQKSSHSYRLLTEAEWEYAARSGGKREKWAGTSNESELGRYAWYNANSGRQTHPVGQKEANGLGLYDMSGNVSEWCADWYGGYSSANQLDPPGRSSGTIRVVRGGSWVWLAGYLRTAHRDHKSPGDRYPTLGFRLATVP